MPVVPVLCAEGQTSHKDVGDETHGGNIKVRGVNIETRSNRSVLLVVHLPILKTNNTIRIPLSYSFIKLLYQLIF